MIDKKILFIGAGNMSESIIRGITSCGIAAPENIIVNNRTPYKTMRLVEIYGVKACKDLAYDIESADIVIIGVKPQDIDDVLKEISYSSAFQQVIVSIAAGKSIAYIEKFLGNERKIIRVMPNTLVTVRKGFSALCKNANATEEDFACVEEIFKGIGDTVRIEEDAFDSFTGFSCTGPAYVYEFLEALIDAGVYAGISREDSAKFALQNMIGACEMILALDEHPAILKEKMTSPGGVTITGLKVLNENGFKGIVQNAVIEGINKAKML